MAFLKSVLFGAPGQYKFNGIDIKFTEEKNVRGVFGNTFFGRSVDACLTSRIFPVLTLGYLHVLFHELSHVSATQLCAKLFGDENARSDKNNYRIEIDTLTCRGMHEMESVYKALGIYPVWDVNLLKARQLKFVHLAGPLAGMGLEAVKLISAVAAANLLPQHIGLPIGILVGTGAACWLFGEIMYAAIGEGDWALIRNVDILSREHVRLTKLYNSAKAQAMSVE